LAKDYNFKKGIRKGLETQVKFAGIRIDAVF